MEVKYRGIEADIQALSQLGQDGGVARSQKCLVARELRKELVVVPGASGHLEGKACESAYSSRSGRTRHRLGGGVPG